MKYRVAASELPNPPQVFVVDFSDPKAALRALLDAPSFSPKLGSAVVVSLSPVASKPDPESAPPPPPRTPKPFTLS